MQQLAVKALQGALRCGNGLVIDQQDNGRFAGRKLVADLFDGAVFDARVAQLAPGRAEAAAG